jgi:hypothetical protein
MIPEINYEIKVYVEIVLKPIVPATEYRQLSRAQAPLLPEHI